MTRVVRRAVLAVAMLFALLSGAHVRVAHAAPPSQPSAEQLREAKTRFERGKALYTLGQYAEAIREFSAGYVAVPRPLFLLNLGQCHRKLGELARAREMYQKFLDEAPDAPEREQVKGLIGDLDREIEAERLARAAREAAEREKQAPPPAVVVAPPPSTVAARPVDRPPPPRRRLWIIPVAIGAAAVVGVAIGVGVWAGTRGDNGPRCGDPGVIGCVDASTQAISFTF